MGERITDLTESADETDAEDLAVDLCCSAREVCLGYFTIPAIGNDQRFRVGGAGHRGMVLFEREMKLRR